MWEQKVFGRSCRIVEKSDRAIAEMYRIEGRRVAVPEHLLGTLGQIRELQSKDGNWANLLDQEVTSAPSNLLE